MTEPEPQPVRSSRLPLILGGAGVTVIVVAAAILLWPDRTPPPSTTVPTTETTGPATTTSDGVTTSAPATTSTLIPTPTTTDTAGPALSNYDVVVVGDGLGGVTAATAAARLGANVALLSPIHYLGGQAGAAGVSTMDEGSNHFVLRRSGMYGELATFLQTLYGPDVGDCYFIEDSLCPEPIIVDGFLRGLLANAGVDIIPITTVTDVLQDDEKVTGVVADGRTYNTEVVIDATEFSDLYPLIEGLNYEVGGADGCVQDTTWLAIRAFYPISPGESLTPPQSTDQDLFSLYGAESEAWLEDFRTRVIAAPDRGSEPGFLPWNVATETEYRALADRRDFSSVAQPPEITRTGVNYANDYALTAAAIEDPAVRLAEFRKALHKTYLFLWYLRWELEVTDWAVDSFQEYPRAQRLLSDDLIPDVLEQHLPPYPYVREARRLNTVQELGPADLANDVRGLHRFDDSVMLGGYFSDFHGCVEPEAGAGFGLFEVPLGVFIPETVDGFMPGIVRAAGVSRSAAAAVRTQPEEMWGGEAVGIVAGIAARDDIEVRDVSAQAVQAQLLANDLIYFLPG